ncbi:MAG: adenylyltransferase/cytidyltransferase family protein [Patescibacteria group bacterium]
MKKEENNKKIIKVAVSGYFNPLHVGHLEMIEQAKKIGDYLIVILNNDLQVGVKGRIPFMPEEDRMKIIKSLRCVDEVFLSVDKDLTVCKSLELVKPDIFANGGDRKTLDDIPEYDICNKLNIKMVDGLGLKIRSSSTLIENANKKKKKE